MTPSPLAIERGLLYIEAPGTALQVRVGELSIRLADGSRHLFRPREHRLRTIVLAGRGNSITTNAVAWLLAEHVELLISENAGQFIGMFAPVADSSRAALKLRKRQFEALDSAKTTIIAQEIMARKIKTEGHSRSIRMAFLAALRKACSTDDIRHIEAQSAQLWWNQWKGFEMRFIGAGVPAGWRERGSPDASFTQLLNHRPSVADYSRRDRTRLRPVLWVSA